MKIPIIYRGDVKEMLDAIESTDRPPWVNEILKKVGNDEISIGVIKEILITILEAERADELKRSLDLIWGRSLSFEVLWKWFISCSQSVNYVNNILKEGFKGDLEELLLLAHRQYREYVIRTILKGLEERIDSRPYYMEL